MFRIVLWGLGAAAAYFGGRVLVTALFDHLDEALQAGKEAEVANRLAEVRGHERRALLEAWRQEHGRMSPQMRARWERALREAGLT